MRGEARLEEDADRPLEGFTRLCGTTDDNIVPRDSRSYALVITTITYLKDARDARLLVPGEKRDEKGPSLRRT